MIALAMPLADLQKKTLFADLVAKGGWSMDRLEFRLSDTFRAIPWQGKDVCEIGCGRGDYGMYMALNGARRVVALEPSAEGSSDAKTVDLRNRVDKLAMPNYTLLECKFDECEFEPESFDLVFGIQVIEHIHETFQDLADDPVARASYEKAFAGFYRILRPGGVLLLTDYSRRNVWTLLQKAFGPRFRGPLTRVIDWQMHQHPRTWKLLARDTGFERTDLWWRVYQPLKHMPWLADNRIFAYFTFASFVFSAYKVR
jgi:SAM-dependent methyltransferase